MEDDGCDIVACGAREQDAYPATRSTDAPHALEFERGWAASRVRRQLRS